MFNYLLSYLLHSTIIIAIVLLISHFKIIKSQELQDSLLKLALVGAFFSTGLVQIQNTNSLTISKPTISFIESQGIKILDELADSSVLAKNSFTKTDLIEEVFPLIEISSEQAMQSKSLNIFILFQILIAMYFVVLGVLSLRIVGAWLELKQILKTKKSLANSKLSGILDNLKEKANYHQAIKLSYSSKLLSPIALINNEICMPKKSLELSHQEQEIMLAHELGHIIRNDPYWLILARFIETVFFFQPLNYLNTKFLINSADLISDDFAIEQTKDNISLAKCLATVAQWQLNSKELKLVSNMARTSSLKNRVKQILSEKRLIPSNKRTKLLLNSFLLLSLIAFVPKVNVFAQTSPSSNYLNETSQNNEIRQIWITSANAQNATFSENYEELIDLPEHSAFIIEEFFNGLRRRITISKLNSKMIFEYSENNKIIPINNDIIYWYKDIMANYARHYNRRQKNNNPYISHRVNREFNKIIPRIRRRVNDRENRTYYFAFHYADDSLSMLKLPPFDGFSPVSLSFSKVLLPLDDISIIKALEKLYEKDDDTFKLVNHYFTFTKIPPTTALGYASDRRLSLLEREVLGLAFR